MVYEVSESIHPAAPSLSALAVTPTLEDAYLFSVTAANGGGGA